MTPGKLFLSLVAGGAVAVLALRNKETGATSALIAYDPGQFETVAVPVEAAPGVLEVFAAQVNGALRKLFQLPAAAAPYADAIRAAEAKWQLPESLLGRVLYQESRFRPDIIEGRTKSSAGAVGIAQFMPATAADLGVDPLDPFQSIDGAGRYLRQLYNATGSWDRALAAYNWGIDNVQRRGLGAAPLETRNYVAEVLADVPV